MYSHQANIPSDTTSLLLPGADGYLSSQGDFSKISEPWTELIDRIVKKYTYNHGKHVHSVYVRGSVACGKAKEGFSDLDMVTVLRCRDSKTQNQSWKGEIRQYVEKYAAFCQGLDMTDITLEQILKPQSRGDMWWRMIIKLSSVCMYGEDLSSIISPYKPNAEMIMQLFFLEQEIRRLKSIQNDNRNEKEVQHECRQIMKRILRSGFEMVIEKEKFYTNDVRLCYQYFCKNYPNKAQDMAKVMNLFLYPLDDLQEIVLIADNLIQWMLSESRDTLSFDFTVM
jgi:hypothetical protein